MSTYLCSYWFAFKKRNIEIAFHKNTKYSKAMTIEYQALLLLLNSWFNAINLFCNNSYISNFYHFITVIVTEIKFSKKKLKKRIKGFYSVPKRARSCRLLFLKARLQIYGNNELMQCLPLRIYEYAATKRKTSELICIFNNVNKDWQID